MLEVAPLVGLVEHNAIVAETVEEIEIIDFLKSSLGNAKRGILYVYNHHSDYS